MGLGVGAQRLYAARALQPLPRRPHTARGGAPGMWWIAHLQARPSASPPCPPVTVITRPAPPHRRRRCCRHAQYDGAAADCWACGVVLFMLLFGRHPFLRPDDEGRDPQQQIMHLFRRVTSPAGSPEGVLVVPHSLPAAATPAGRASHAAPVLSPGGADLLRRLLERDPRRRVAPPGVGGGVPGGSIGLRRSSTLLGCGTPWQSLIVSTLPGAGTARVLCAGLAAPGPGST